MKEKEISVRHVYFDLLKKEEKTIEGRLYDAFFRDLDVGDHLIFLDESTGEKLKTEVKKIAVFPEFASMITTLTQAPLGFKDFTFEETLRTYNSFYTQDEIKEYGVCGVFVKVI